LLLKESIIWFALLKNNGGKYNKGNRKQCDTTLVNLTQKGRFHLFILLSSAWLRLLLRETLTG